MVGIEGPRREHGTFWPWSDIWKTPGCRERCSLLSLFSNVIVAHTRLLQNPDLEVNKAKVRVRDSLKLKVPNWISYALVSQRTEVLETCWSLQQTAQIRLEYECRLTLAPLGQRAILQGEKSWLEIIPSFLGLRLPPYMFF